MLRALLWWYCSVCSTQRYIKAITKFFEPKTNTQQLRVVPACCLLLEIDSHAIMENKRSLWKIILVVVVAVAFVFISACTLEDEIDNICLIGVCAWRHGPASDWHVCLHNNRFASVATAALLLQTSSGRGNTHTLFVRVCYEFSMNALQIPSAYIQNKIHIDILHGVRERESTKIDFVRDVNGVLVYSLLTQNPY